MTAVEAPATQCSYPVARPAPGTFDVDGVLVRVNPPHPSDGTSRVWTLHGEGRAERQSLLVGFWSEHSLRPAQRTPKTMKLVEALAEMASAGSLDKVTPDGHRRVSGPCPICETHVQNLSRHKCRSKKAQRGAA